jgi:hypothetical protein
MEAAVVMGWLVWKMVSKVKYIHVMRSTALDIGIGEEHCINVEGERKVIHIM